MNRLATVRTSSLSWSLIDEALGQDGAVYLLDRNAFVSNVRDLRTAFCSSYTNSRLAYSCKTNYLPTLIEAALSFDMYIEVVSRFEFDFCLGCGVPSGKIIFNGPAKAREDVITAVRSGALVNIDSVEEAHYIADLASNWKGEIRVGVRCSLKISYRDRPTRFGMSDETHELSHAFEILRSAPSVKIAGLHCHSSYDRTLQSFEKRTRDIIAVWKQHFPESSPGFIDVGGGFSGRMPDELQEQLRFKPPSYEEYAKAVAGVMADHFGKFGKPELILEPGVGLLGDVMALACRVVSIKRLKDRTFIVVATTGPNLKIKDNGINLPVSVVKQHINSCATSEPTAVADVVGYTCLEHDVIYEGLEANVLVGDVLIFENVGAYSLSSSPNFIRATPSVKVLEPGGRWDTVWRKLSPGDFLEAHAPRGRVP